MVSNPSMIGDIQDDSYGVLLVCLFFYLVYADRVHGMPAIYNETKKQHTKEICRQKSEDHLYC